MHKKRERKEALIRIFVLIVSGVIITLWTALVKILAVVNLLMTLVTGRRNKHVAEFCEIWNTQVYVLIRYVTFVNNERPFPFSKLEKNMSKFE